MHLECFQLTLSGKAGLLELARPEKLNVLDEQALDELEDLLNHLQGEGVKAVVLTGQGRAFAAGADVKAMAEMDPEAARAFSFIWSRVSEMLSPADRATSTVEIERWRESLTAFRAPEFER